MTPFTAVFQYRRCFASPESGGIEEDCGEKDSTWYWNIGGIYDPLLIMLL